MTSIENKRYNSESDYELMKDRICEDGTVVYVDNEILNSKNEVIGYKKESDRKEYHKNYYQMNRERVLARQNAYYVKVDKSVVKPKQTRKTKYKLITDPEELKRFNEAKIAKTREYHRNYYYKNHEKLILKQHNYNIKPEVSARRRESRKAAKLAITKQIDEINTILNNTKL